MRRMLLIAIVIACLGGCGAPTTPQRLDGDSFAQAVASDKPLVGQFEVDMRSEISENRFDPSAATVGIRGSLPPLSWGVTLPAADPEGDGLFEVEVPFPAGGDTLLQYKFKVDRPGEANGGWEQDPNRRLILRRGSLAVKRAFNAPVPAEPPSHTGDIRTHPAFPSGILGRSRDIWVYLPPGYAAQGDVRYPVLYLQDGQNVFDDRSAGAEWGADEALERMVAAGEVEPVIVVAVGNTGSRTEEYTPSTGLPGQGGGADAYGRFLVEELKSFVDRTYRTLPDAGHTSVGGSSLGGLLAMYLGLRHPEAFGGLLVVSPSVWWDDAAILDLVQSTPKPAGQRIWLDMGSEEGDGMLRGARSLRDALVLKGWTDGVDFRYEEAPGAAHNERAWALRLPDMLRFLYGAG